MEIKELDKKLIERANSCSFNNTRGDISEQSYKSYVNEILSWNISDGKKQKILDKLYEKYSRKLSYEAQHVSVMVAGPARYNAKKLDKSDKILELSSELYQWFEDLKKQVKDLTLDKDTKKIDYLVSRITFCVNMKGDPKDILVELAYLDNEKFIQLYEKYNETYKWRKNSTIYKVYQKSLNGEIKEIKKELIYEDENFLSYIEGDRAYIKFPMKIQPQLIYALKKKGWWWNSNKKAWSTYLGRLDKGWISTISEKYEHYL